MKTFAMLVTAAVVVMVAAPWAAAREVAQGKRTERGATAKPEIYVVVQVGNDVKVVTKSEFKNLPKSVREEDKKAAKEYDEQKKIAAKNKEKLDTPKPLPRKVTKLGKEFKTQEEANDWANNWIDKHPAGSKTGGAKTEKKVY